MSKSNKSFGHYLLYTLMALSILLTIAATLGVYRKVVDTSNTTMLIAAISAIGSCASAVASLYVANRTQKLSEMQRETEREETNAKIRQNRQRIAAVYAAEIRAWLRRRDLNKFLSDLGGLKTKSEILGTIEVSLAARRSNRKIAGPDISAKHDLQDIIVWQARKSAELLAVSSFAKFRTIPSIWTALFRREDTEVLGVGTMAFFISMKNVWINLTLATAQIPSSEEVVEFVNGQQPEHAEKYLGKLIGQVFVLRDLFKFSAPPPLNARSVWKERARRIRSPFCPSRKSFRTDLETRLLTGLTYQEKFDLTKALKGICSTKTTFQTFSLK